MPTTVVTNPRGAHGESASGYNRNYNPYQTTAAVAAKAVVAIDTTGKKVATAATDGVAALAVGIAINAAASGDTVLVAEGGSVVTGVPVDGATTAGVILKRSVTTAGSLAATATPGVGESFAVSLVASASNTTTVRIL